jgi:hypothetical protein
MCIRDSGTPKAASVATAPPGLGVLVTYAGSTSAPAAAGSYTVVATIADTLYQGSAAGTLVITPTLTATPAISLAADGSLSVPSLPGYLYQLQTSTTLATGSWLNVGPPRSGTGVPLVVVPDLAPVNGRRFYRFVITPSAQ